MRFPPRILTAIFLFVPAFAGAPQPRASDTVADPGFLEAYASTYRFRLGRPTSIKVTPDGRAVLFLRSGPRSFERNLYELDVKTGKERELLTAQSILRGADEKLTAEEQARRERMRLAARGIASYVLSRDGKRLLVPLSGRLFVIERANGSVRELTSDGGFPIDPQFSPDGERVSCVRDGEVHVIDIATGRERRLTEDAEGSIVNGLAEFVAQEEMSRYHGVWWSPDSTRIVYQQTDTDGLEIMNIMDATHPEIAPETWPYPRPGKRNASVRLGIVPADGGSTTWINWDRRNFEYLAVVKWMSNAPLTILVQDRRQREQRLLSVDADSGATETLLVETDDAWVEIDQSVPRWLPDGSGFLWTTERRGALQLELRASDGSLDRVLTAPELGMQGFVHHTTGTDEVIVRASADPTETHLYRIALDEDDAEPERLTSEPGLHGGTFSRDGQVWVHSASLLTGESRWDVVGRPVRDGTELRSLAEEPPFMARVELTTVGSAPELHAALIRPRNFDASQVYPVIVHVYGGPTSQMVRASAGRYLLDQWIADHGYVVVAIDGRGTPNRGREFHRIVRGDLIEVPLADQARGLRALGDRYPELDLSRVGIYGWSFGGYFSAMAVMREPGLFHAGVAGAPVVDWADYDTHYTERYMDLPQRNESGYRAANVLTYASDLERPLMIIHGTADDNVYFMHSLKLADALFREGKSYEFLPLAGFTHMVPDPLITKRLYSRIMSFLDRNVRARETP